MGKDIKGINLEIGASTTQFNKVMKDMSAVTRATQNELNAVNKALKFDPKNVDLLKQKEELLGKQLEDVRLKVDKMKAAKEKADKEMANGTEVNQEQYRTLVREISAAEGQLKSLIKQSDKFGNSARELGGKIEGIGKKGMAVSGAIVGIGTAAVTMGIKAAQSADDINTLSKQTGLSTEQIQKFQYASERIDVPLETLTGSMAKLTRNMQSAKNGSKNTQQAFKELGISITDNQGKLRNNQDVFNEAIDALAKMENGTQRDALAMQIFGKSAQELNPLILGGSEALKQYGEEAEKAGLILSQETLDSANELSDAVDKLKATATGAFAKVGAEIATKLTPVIEPASEALVKVVDVVSDLDEKQVKLIAGIGVGLATIPPLLIGTGKMITAIGTISTAYKTLTASATASSVAMKAIPYVAVATAAIGLVSIITSDLKPAESEEIQRIREKTEAIKEEHEAYQGRINAAKNAAMTSISELTYCEKLKEELESLADEKGRVAESDKTRAEILVGQLNSALGTEYSMTGNIIKNYLEMITSVESLIATKKAEALLEAKHAPFKEAVQEIEGAKLELDAASKAYQETYEILKSCYDEDGNFVGNEELGITDTFLSENELVEKLNAQKETLDEAQKNYETYVTAINDYTNLETEIATKGAQAVIDEWSEKSGMMTSTQRDVANNYNQAILDLEEYSTNYKNGVSGYTAEGLAIIQQHVVDMKRECENVGIAVDEGIAEGVGNSDEAKNAIETLCDNIPEWCKKILGINSPAKKTIPIGMSIDEGIAEGIKRDTSAEEAIERKCKNLESILKKRTELFDVSIELAESKYDLFLAENPNATDSEIQAQKEAMLNKQYEEQGLKIQAVNDALLYQIQLTGAESKESEELLIQLNKEKIAYIELGNAIKEANDAKAGGSGGIRGVDGFGGLAGGSAKSAYTAYHVQYGALLKGMGVTQEEVDKAARKYSGYTGEGGININYNISGTTPDTAYKVGQETTKNLTNMAMQGVL